MKFSEIIPALEAGHAMRRGGWPSATFLQRVLETGSLRMSHDGGDSTADWQPCLGDIVSDDWRRVDGLDAVAADAIVDQAHILRMLAHVASKIESALDHPGVTYTVDFKFKTIVVCESLQATLKETLETITALGMKVWTGPAEGDDGVWRQPMAFTWNGDKPTMDGSR